MSPFEIRAHLQELAQERMGGLTAGLDVGGLGGLLG